MAKKKQEVKLENPVPVAPSCPFETDPLNPF